MGGKQSGERLYLVKYTDGDVEHLTADQVREMSCTLEEVSSATQPPVPVPSPARNGTVATRGEAIASESDVDAQKKKSSRSLLPLGRRRPVQRSRHRRHRLL